MTPFSRSTGLLHVLQIYEKSEAKGFQNNEYLKNIAFIYNSYNLQ